MSSPSVTVDFFAGCVGGVASILFTYPMDLVKSRLQVQQHGRFRGVLHCLSQTVKEESVVGLYRGIGSPLSGVAIYTSINFGVYAASMKVIGDAQRGLRKTFLSGVCAGLVTSLVKSHWN